METLQLKKIGDCENIRSVNPLHLIVSQASGYIEEKNGSKYLVFDSTDENKEVFENTQNFGMGLKNEIETIIGGKVGDYGIDFKKIKFNSDDDLPLNKHLQFPTMTMVVRSVFEDGKYYPQISLDQCLYEL